MPIGRETRPRISEIVENVVGCKWTLHVLAEIRAGGKPDLAQLSVGVRELRNLIQSGAAAGVTPV